MKTFHFCLGARRALDYAVFFDGRNSQLAEIKRDQARLLSDLLGLNNDNTDKAEGK